MPKHPTGQQIQAHLADDLRFVYLLAFDSFAIDAGDVVTASESRINNRYSRELLAVLTQANLLSLQDVNGEQDVWQVANPGTYDGNTREDAEAVIDAWLKQHDLAIATAKVPTPQKEKSVTEKPATNVEFAHCRCGCEANVPPKSWYKPGHDARHAGIVGRAIAAQVATPGFDRRTLLDALPSDSLKAKAEGIAETAIKKAEAKAARKAERGEKVEPAPKTAPYAEGKIKVARKAFPARKYEGGVWEVNENQDGTGKWIETELTDAQQRSFVEVVTEAIDTTQQG